MPTYVYKCSECNQTFEYVQKMSDEKKKRYVKIAEDHIKK